MEVAVGLEGNVDQGVARELLDHVVEKADPSGDVIGASPVEVDGRRDRGLLGAALDCRPPRLSLFAVLLHSSHTSARALAIRFLAQPLIREQAWECYQSVN